MQKQKITSQNNNLNECLFFLAYSIYLLFAFVKISFLFPEINKIGKTAMITCIIIIVAKELLSKISKKEVLLLFTSIFLSLIIYLHTNGYLMLPLFVLVYGARNIPFRKIAKFTLVAELFLLCTTIALSKIGLITDYISYANGRERDYLGFKYALFPSMIGLNITALAAYLNKDNNKLVNVIFLVFSTALFLLTDSRLFFAVSILLLIITILIRKTKNKTIAKRFLGALPLSFIACSLLSLLGIFTFTGNNATINSLDEKIEHRISLGKASLELYPINLFGHDVRYVGAGLREDGTRSNKSYNYVDCLYLNMIEKYGLIYFTVYIAIMTALLIRLKKANETILLVIVSSFAVIGILDDLSMHLHYNSFILAAGIRSWSLQEKRNSKSKNANQMNHVLK